MSRTVSAPEFGRIIGVNRQRVYDYIKEGRLQGAVKKVQKKYVIDLEKGRKLLEDSMDTRQPSKVLSGASINRPFHNRYTHGNGNLEDQSLSEIRRVHESIKASIAQLELDKKLGTLISVDEINMAAFNVARQCRDQLMSIPDRCAALVAAENDPFACKKILIDEVSTILGDLSDRLAALVPDKK